ncbi:hypothetical protein [Methylobacterium platani]|nr:hypothetical protein [Methylobacterium platani]
MLLRTADEAVPPLAGSLAAKGYGIVDAGGGELPAGPLQAGTRVVDLALVSAGLSASPDLPGVATRLRAVWPRLPLVGLPGAAPASGLPVLPGDLSLPEICERLDEIVLAAAQSRADAAALRRTSLGLVAQLRQARLGLTDAVADARRLLAEARRLSARDRPGDRRS